MKANGIMIYYSHEMIAIFNCIAVSLAGFTSLIACKLSCASFLQSLLFLGLRFKM